MPDFSQQEETMVKLHNDFESLHCGEVNITSTQTTLDLKNLIAKPQVSRTEEYTHHRLWTVNTVT